MRKIGVLLGICIAAFVVLVAIWPLLTGAVSDQKLAELGVLDEPASFVDVGGVQTRYAAKGEGGQPIVLIHGFSSSLFTWQACLDALAQQHRVYALDLKGFGFSQKPESAYTIDEYVDFVAAFMDRLDIPSAVWCGSSMGGNISWRAALKYPDRVDKLILVDASGYPSDHKGAPLIMKLGRLPGVGDLFAGLTTRGQIRSSLESAYFDNGKVTDRTVDMYYYPLKTEGGMRAVLARLRSHSSEEPGNWYEQIPSLKLPTLIVWGAEDTWVPIRDAHRFNQDVEGSELVVFPECGHLPQEEFPQEFAQHVLDFLTIDKKQVIMEQAPVFRPVHIKMLTAHPVLRQIKAV